MPDQMALEMGMITGAVFSGSLSGLIPVASACRRGRFGAAVVGFVLCIGAGFAGGFLFALPIALLLGGIFNFLPKAAYREPTLEEAGVFINPYANGRRSAFENHFETAMGPSAETHNAAAPLPG